MPSTTSIIEIIFNNEKESMSFTGSLNPTNVRDRCDWIRCLTRKAAASREYFIYSTCSFAFLADIRQFSLFDRQNKTVLAHATKNTHCDSLNNDTLPRLDAHRPTDSSTSMHNVTSILQVTISARIEYHSMLVRQAI